MRIRRVMGSIGWAIGAAIAVAGCATAGDLGTYRFADGTCVTGGRFGESGIERLLLMDVVGQQRGGLFEGGPRTFGSVFGPTGAVAFTDGHGALDWTDPSGTERATRVHAPRMFPARIEADGAVLAGTLYLPDAAVHGPYPGVVLAHGSGPQDRHAGPWTTFFVDLGMAVLAYDKRGVGESSGDYASADYGMLGDDLAAAVRWLARHPETDEARVGIHASSQSGWYAPSVVARAPVAFLIGRATPALPIGPTTLHERTLEWRDEGLLETAIVAASALWRDLMAAAAAGESRDAAQQRIDRAVGEDWFASAFGDGWKTIDAGWWRRQQANARFDPVADLARHPVPTLWFLADQDENVPYAQSAAALQAPSQSNPAFELVTVEGAAHDFLVRDASGIRYTRQYWQVMAGWLAAKGFAGQATPASTCGSPG